MEDSKRRLYYFLSLFLIGIGMAVSLYLAVLFVQLNLGLAVDSFCAINEKFNCVTVANCEYSTVLGIPVAVYGIQFYFILLLVLLMSGAFKYPIRDWASFQFFLSASSLPVSLILALISVFWIESFCILCGTVYLVNVLLFLLAGKAGGWKLKELAVSWFLDIRTAVKGSKVFEFSFMAVVMLALSQFVFLPKMFEFDSSELGNGWLKGTVSVPQSDDPFLLGSPDALVRVEEFTDFQCPFCLRAHSELLKVFNKYPEIVSIRHVDYPLDNQCNPNVAKRFHPEACLAAFYGKCAGAQGRFWELEKLMFLNQSSLSHKRLDRLARSVGLDIDALQQCLADPKTKEAVLEDIAAGKAIKLTGTPTFVVNGEVVRGYRTAEFWEKKVLAAAAKARLEQAMRKRDETAGE